MKTKQILALVAILLLGINYVAAQGFGVRAGVNFQNINGKDASGDALENKLITGFNIGANYEIPVGTDIYFQPGLLFSTKGGKSTGEILGVKYDSKVMTSNIEVPLNIIFKPLLGTGHMLLGFGPYVAYGIGGKVKVESGGEEEESDIEFTNEVTEDDLLTDKYYLKPFDAGANFIIGYELESMLSLQLNAQLGLLNIYPKQPVDTETSFKNTGFGLSIGYRF
ncbi:MAG TPA: outer membrane beta-barrel protein [Lentimicrobium sp.]|nr:outer membrane beta-barrel protein [Lentimicrobium sp.]